MPAMNWMKYQNKAKGDAAMRPLRLYGALAGVAYPCISRVYPCLYRRRVAATKLTTSKHRHYLTIE